MTTGALLPRRRRRRKGSRIRIVTGAISASHKSTQDRRGVICMVAMENTTDEMIASVDATLASWRSAFKSSPRKERANNSDAGGGGTSPSTSINDSKSPPSWKDPDAYQRRLSASNQIPTLRNRWRCHPLFVLLFGEYHLALVYSNCIMEGALYLSIARNLL